MEQARYSWLCCEILANNPYTNASSINLSIWQRLLPQLCHQNPAVHTAAAAFGSAYEWSNLASGSDAISRSVVSQYASAITSVQAEINNMPNGPVPLLLACVLLASTELLQRRQYHALTHLEGAFQILSLHEQSVTLRESSDTRSAMISSDGNNMGRSFFGNELIFLFQSLDVQLASYRFTCPPYFVYARDIHLRSQLDEFLTEQEALLRLIPILNTCYRFIASARQPRSREKTPAPWNISIEQGRHLASLNNWLRILEIEVLGIHKVAEEDARDERRCLARILRTQCMSTIINLCTVTCSQETAYDDHAPRFEQIIADTEQVLDQTHTFTPSLSQFSLGVGIAEPLFLTACKYRNSQFRRRAITLLCRLGREGPWDGKLLVAVAKRVVELEEQGLVDRLLVVPEAIKEERRIHSCTMTEMQSGGLVSVDFVRCRDGAGNADERPQGMDEDEERETWREILPYGPQKAQI